MLWNKERITIIIYYEWNSINIWRYNTLQASVENLRVDRVNRRWLIYCYYTIKIIIV